ncbi:hypothetical protein ACFL2U_03985 [Patescibacteria group bacterium]
MRKLMSLLVIVGLLTLGITPALAETTTSCPMNTEVDETVGPVPADCQCPQLPEDKMWYQDEKHRRKMLRAWGSITLGLTIAVVLVVGGPR